MKRENALLICFGLMFLASCQRVENGFVVRDPEGVVATAELRVCGKHQPLSESQGVFSTQLGITCEGSGDIRVRLKNGSETTCPVGYVTPGLKQSLEYKIQDGVCAGSAPDASGI